MSRFNIVADRYIYLASVGLFVIIALSITSYKKVVWRKRYFWRMLIAYILYLGIYANIRTRVWHDNETLKNEIKILLEKRTEIEKQSSEMQTIAPNKKAPH